MTTERDPDTRIVLSWLREEQHENAERVLLRALDEVDATPQRRSWWPAWRTNRMQTYAKVIATAAAMLVVAIGGYQLLPAVSGPAGTNVPLTPRLPLVARGVFALDAGAVTIAAIAEGSSVTGRLLVQRGAVGSSDYLDVDLQCTRTTIDGLILIGGSTTRVGIDESPPPSLAAIVLKRGSPAQAAIWFPTGAQPASGGNCLAFLDAQVVGVQLEPIDGFVELGTDAAPLAAGLPLLARGDFALADDGDGEIHVDAVGQGSTVTGRMTQGDVHSVDLQCARTTDDGLLMIGGYQTEDSGLAPAGTLVAIVLKRGSPVQAAIWAQEGGPTSRAASCLAFLDEQLLWERNSDADGVRVSPIEGTVELGVSETSNSE